MNRAIYDPMKTVQTKCNHQVIYAKPVIHEPIFLPYEMNMNDQRQSSVIHEPFTKFRNYPIQPNLFQPINMPTPQNLPGSHAYQPIQVQEQVMHQDYSKPPITTTTTNMNPIQPQEGQSNEGYFSNPLYNQMNLQHPMYNPYPKMKILPKNQSPGTSLMSSFKGPDGNFDLVSVVNTCGQMVNVVNQVSGIFKGLGGMFKI